MSSMFFTNKKYANYNGMGENAKKKTVNCFSIRFIIIILFFSHQ